MTNRRQLPRQRVHMTISPVGWDLPRASDDPAGTLASLVMPQEQMEERAHNNTYEWLPRQFDDEVGAFHGFYDARQKSFADPQTVNLIAPFQCMAAFDRYEDEQFLDMARRSAEWLNDNLVETHPMSLVLGGVLDNMKPTQLWTKYAGDYVILNLGLWERLEEEVFLDQAIQSSRFLLQAQNHGFAPKYDHWHETWVYKGWQSFGRVICAMIALQEFVEDDQWLEWARQWAEHGLTLQEDNGCFHLINNTYYSSDIAADEIRGLIRMSVRTDERRYLAAAFRFADWHVRRQDSDGSWPLSEDRFGIAVTNYKGPGDMPNIAIALLLAHKVSGDAKYVISAAKAIRYGLGQQQIPGPVTGRRPYLSDLNTHWGFWSWDPRYDYTMSADQSTHHCRGCWFFQDYVLSLPAEEQARLVSAMKEAEQQKGQAV